MSERIVIRYWAGRSRRDPSEWAPYVMVNARHLSEWVSLDQIQALAMAKRMAEEEAARYSGDWEIELVEVKP